MFERSEKILKMVSAALALLVLTQALSALTRKDPLGDVEIPKPPAPALASEAPEAKETNAPAGLQPRRPGPGAAPKVPPEIQARIDKIKESEILGPVQRPLPMALLGLAGSDALIRSPGGQTDWVKEGGELGGLKLLRIGTNRVLIEHEGEKKELTLFSGFGSDSLLPKDTKKEQPR